MVNKILALVGIVLVIIPLVVAVAFGGLGFDLNTNTQLVEHTESGCTLIESTDTEASLRSRIVDDANELILTQIANPDGDINIGKQNSLSKQQVHITDTVSDRNGNVKLCWRVTYAVSETVTNITFNSKEDRANLEDQSYDYSSKRWR